jgi:hypothetical protein
MGTATGWEGLGPRLVRRVLTTLGDPQAAEPTTVRVLRFHAGLENWFRWALRNLARSAANGAGARTRPSSSPPPAATCPPTPDPGPRPDRGAMPRDALGDDRFEELAAHGEAKYHDQLMDL